MKEAKRVSIAVPCRNEERYILNFLEGIKSQDYPLENLEVVIADGESEDKTREIIEGFAKENPELKIKVVTNKKRITPAAYNVAVRNSTGDYIMTSGAHSQISSNYVSGCVKDLEDFSDAVCVGGSIETLPSGKTEAAKAIAISLSHPFGTGNAKFRTRTGGPVFVDTVYHGCYRREVFKKIGDYNEKLFRSQDLDLNLRIVKSGLKILLDPTLKIRYYPKSNFKDIALYHFRCGLWVPRAARITKRSYKIRHYLPLIVFLSGLALLLGSFWSSKILTIFVILAAFYLAMSLYFSVRIALEKEDLKLAVYLPLAFFLRHFFFGLGSFVGLIY